MCLCLHTNTHERGERESHCDNCPETSYKVMLHAEDRKLSTLSIETWREVEKADPIVTPNTKPSIQVYLVSFQIPSLEKWLTVQHSTCCNYEYAFFPWLQWTSFRNHFTNVKLYESNQMQVSCSFSICYVSEMTEFHVLTWKSNDLTLSWLFLDHACWRLLGNSQ